MSMADFHFILFFYSLLLFLAFKFCTAADHRNQMTFKESIPKGQVLLSANQRFELGFFSPSSSNNRSYLGIWYKNFPQIVVWIANRNSPLTDSYGVLTFSGDGNLVLLNSTKGAIWSSNSSTSLPENSLVVQLLDTGNLVVRENRNTVDEESYKWQSFHYPSDTLLPGMKIGWDWITGETRYLTSWKDISDPSPGDFTYRLDILGLPEGVISQGLVKKYRTGGWNGVRFSGAARSTSSSSPVFNDIFVNNPREAYTMYEIRNDPFITRLTLNQSGFLQRSVLYEGSSVWTSMFETPLNNCDEYNRCGPNGICKINKLIICECLEGFVPKSEREWYVLDRTSGCRLRTPLDCQKGDGFLKVKNVKLPDLLPNQFLVNKSMSLKECKAECLKNCSCTAYTNSDISGRHSGCVIWYGDLLDIREFVSVGSEQDMYIRMASSELGDNNKRKRVVLIVVISTVVGFLGLIFLVWCSIQKWKMRRDTNKEDMELPLFELATIASATNNFCVKNMIGEGGFGAVYKGKLSSGQEIAVKRLSAYSGQGVGEFKNEAILISKLQHRNLVRLLGCCLAGEERLLVYEYMPNHSLNYFIFDANRRALLNWPTRFEIAMGIAKGLLYLHHDSRLRIIHRDLKGSNILLDSKLNPKISDFGIARIFESDQIEAKTNRVIGTYGYMSPEYTIDGKFSEKSDVFSFGVLLLEIVSGKRNTNYRNLDHHHSLLGHAWLLWNEGKALELMDNCLEDSYVESQVLRCIQISLLCFQKFPIDRPTMSSVVFMLGNENVTLPEPKQPGFFIERSSSAGELVNTDALCTSENELTITVMEAR